MAETREPCSECGGKGWRVRYLDHYRRPCPEPAGVFGEWYDCPACVGTGKQKERAAHDSTEEK